MDVQMENADPPPCESQSSGKIRKGFKLFGKRKPGNIFSIQNKGDGNHKSPVIGSNTLDGLTDTAAPDLEQDTEKENDQEVSQGENGQAEEEMLGEDGVLAAAASRYSISSATSAKSLSFLSLLRGGRRGGADRQVQTVSQPAGRQRRGLKGLFGNVRFRPKDKESKNEAPPSPLLMSSRTNSVEIIKEDLTLTPKSQSHSLDSPKTESYEPGKSLTTTQDSSATSPSETIAPQMTTGNVSRTNEHVLSLPTTEPPMVPGENSLSSLLADISSLLTFDSITGGGDIIADVEAEWGKAYSAISAVETEGTPSMTVSSKPAVSSSPVSAPSISTTPIAKPSPLTTQTTTQTQSFTPTTKTTMTSSPVAQPSSIMTTSTKSSILTTHSVKSSLDCTPATESTTFITIKSTPTHTATTKPSTTPVKLTSFSTPRTSSPPITTKSTPCSTTAVSTAPLIPPAVVVKTSSVSLPLTSTVQKLASEITVPTKVIAPVSKDSPVATPPAAPAKTTTGTQSPPAPVAFRQPPPAKLDSTNDFNLHTSSFSKPSQSSVTGEAVTCTVTTQLSSAAPVVSSKITTVPTSTPAPASVSVALAKSTHTPSPVTLNAIPPSLVTIPDLLPTPTPTAMSASKTQPSPVSVPIPTTLDKISPTTMPTPTPFSLNKMPPAPTSIPASASQAVVPTSFPMTPVPAQEPISVFKSPPPTCPIISSPPTPSPLQSETPTSEKMKIIGQASVDGQLPSPSTADSPGAMIISPKTEQIQNDSRTTIQGPTRERRIPQGKAAGLSKIPVVGGGRAGKLPVQDYQHIDEETSRDPPTPVLEEEKPRFNLQDRGNKDKIRDVEANVPTSPQEESHQPHQPKVIPSLPRDSKIPVKHGAQSHIGSQIPQAKDPPRSKIPVSKVPVRRVGNKPAAAGAQIRK
ncbi:hypothetical protein LDENG_00299770 [Lucifuga dentata]|nr:hypothetical protein LDENG_00299770 [Lucifuga dentata]